MQPSKEYDDFRGLTKEMVSPPCCLRLSRHPLGCTFCQSCGETVEVAVVAGSYITPSLANATQVLLPGSPRSLSHETLTARLSSCLANQTLSCQTLASWQAATGDRTVLRSRPLRLLYGFGRLFRLSSCHEIELIRPRNIQLVPPALYCVHCC